MNSKMLNEIRKYELSSEYVKEVANKFELNKIVVDYYERLSAEPGQDFKMLSNTAERLDLCCSAWFFDVYKQQRVKDLKNINLCKNKFCLNCQKLMQSTRLMRFSPELEKLAEDYDLYHCIFTVPNCSAKDLKKVVDNIFDRFRYMIRYFKLDAKIKGLDFSKFGYVGCLRTLEITYNLSRRAIGQEYHPHLHTIFAFKKDLNFEKNNINRFSYSYGNFKDGFSDFEILLQKIWYLLLEHKTVDLSSIENVEDGYSVKIELIDKNAYYEVFKYAMKIFNEDSNIIQYEQFKTLYTTLYKRRTIQGYGLLHNIKQDDEISEQVKAGYYDFIKRLQKLEKPEPGVCHINAMIEPSLSDIGFYRTISGRSVFQLFKEGEIEVTPRMVESYQKFKQEQLLFNKPTKADILDKNYAVYELSQNVKKKEKKRLEDRALATELEEAFRLKEEGKLEDFVFRDYCFKDYLEEKGDKK